jgi:molybdopterin molybdotransferase
MLNVKTPEQVLEIIQEQFPCLDRQQSLPLPQALGKVLYEDIAAREFVPDFDRSSVDGYAVRAADTFGCSSAMPAIFPLQGEVIMGQAAPALQDGHCLYVPTGGAIPENADAVVMIEYSEDYGDHTIGISKPAAPGHNIIFRGDDVSPGKTVLAQGKRLEAQDLGALAALGYSEVPVAADIRVGVISTGDELVPVSAVPAAEQVRDINSAMVSAAMRQSGCQVTCYGIVADEEQLLRQAVEQAMAENDLLLISGGSSVGIKDATAKVIDSLGEILLHGIAIKPGKPTIIGKSGSKALIGLPGHPAAAFFICHLFIRPLLWQMQGRRQSSYLLPARLTEAISANDGRTQYLSVALEQRADGLYALPLRAKSSQITNLAATAGYICIPGNAEGLAAGSMVEVALYGTE